ncbi:unnamed protein product [Closterium sp. NIES-54]
MARYMWHCRRRGRRVWCCWMRRTLILELLLSLPLTPTSAHLLFSHSLTLSPYLILLPEPPEELDVVITGAGLAGLREAVALQEAGVTCVGLEASDGRSALSVPRLLLLFSHFPSAFHTHRAPRGAGRGDNRSRNRRATSSGSAAGGGGGVCGAGGSGRAFTHALPQTVPLSLPSLHSTPSEPPEELDVVIIGAGLAGLRAAVALQEAGVACVVLEAADGVGGRVRTDKVDGFLLDRGFQIFLSGEPLRGVWVADPFRHTSDGLGSLFNPIGSVFDKMRVGLLRLKAVSTPVEGILSAPESSIEEALKKQGFSNEMIDRFFRPFLGGIFFDNELSTSSSSSSIQSSYPPPSLSPLLTLLLRSHPVPLLLSIAALAPNTLPSSGIGALASHLASRLPSDSIRLNSPVSSISPVVPTDEADSKGSEAGSGVPSLLTTQDGKRILAKGGVIVAVEQPVAQRLLLGEGGSDSSSSSSSSSGDDTANITSASANQEPRSTVCLYFASDSPPPVAEPILFLNGSGSGIVNNLCFPSVVSPSYAPPGKTLVSVSLTNVTLEKVEFSLPVALALMGGQLTWASSASAWHSVTSGRRVVEKYSSSPERTAWMDGVAGIGI